MREQQFEMAAGAMGVSEQELPLAFRMMEHFPGFMASAGFMAHRGSNTLISGGRFDYLDQSATGRAGKKAKRLQQKFRVFNSVGQMTKVNSGQFVGGAGSRRGMLGKRLSSRAAAKATAVNIKSLTTGTSSRSLMGASNFSARAFRANFLTGKPSALNRMHSMSIFAPASMGAYSPFAASTFVSKSSKFTNYAAEKMRLTPTPGENFFGPGLLSFISAGTKIDRIEKKALRGNQRALNKLGRIDQNIRTLAGVNNPVLLAQTLSSTGARSVSYSQALSMTSAQRGGLTATEYAAKFAPPPATMSSFIDDATKNMIGATSRPVPIGPTFKGNVGVRGNLMASSMHGAGSRYVAGYFRGAMGYGQVAGLEGAAKVGAEKAAAHLAGKGATKYMAQGARALGFALPGINVLMTASLIYDLGKMAGEVIKSGINLARDANKSLQGSINKPLFGMGYKDTEAAATSRARGVMAIQNSRLNARSMLGSEASMLAAHYG